MKKRIGNLIEMYIIWKANLRLRYAIKKAEDAHAKQGDRFFVMPDAFDRLIVMRRKGMRNLRRHGIMDRRVRMPDVWKESFYFTADRGGNKLPPDVMEKKRLMYLDYVLTQKRQKGILRRFR